MYPTAMMSPAMASPATHPTTVVHPMMTMAARTAPEIPMASAASMGVLNGVSIAVITVGEAPASRAFAAFSRSCQSEAGTAAMVLA